MGLFQASTHDTQWRDMIKSLIIHAPQNRCILNTDGEQSVTGSRGLDARSKYARRRSAVVAGSMNDWIGLIDKFLDVTYNDRRAPSPESRIPTISDACGKAEIGKPQSDTFPSSAPNSKVSLFGRGRTHICVPRRSAQPDRAAARTLRSRFQSK